MFGVAACALGAGIFTVDASAEPTDQCKRAACNDPNWVKACAPQSTDACKMLEQGKSIPSTNAKGFPPDGVRQANSVMDVKALSPRMKLGTKAPVDTRALSVGRGTPATDANKQLQSVLAVHDTLIRLEDQNRELKAREDAAMVNIHPDWVGDPLHENFKAPNQHWRVTSCADYAYKKNFEPLWLLETVRALGSDYRAIFDLATRSDSKLRIANR
jgi:hypothetical protein